MFRNFKFTPTDLSRIKADYNKPPLFEIYNKGLESFNRFKKPIEEMLDAYLTKDNILDGSKMREDWFPQIDADIFLSHSHGDEHVAIYYACLFSRMGLTTFIDSCIWGYANKLLKKIDNDYCLNSRNLYDYEKRNQSTSHVHMMLSTALNDMIDKSECMIFLNTPNSVRVSDIKEGKTLSPWIYNELAASKIIRKNIPERLRTHQEIRRFSDGGKLVEKAYVTEELKIEYTFDLSELHDINLERWIDSYNRISSKNEKSGLDALYSSHPLKEKPYNVI